MKFLVIFNNVGGYFIFSIQNVQKFRMRIPRTKRTALRWSANPIFKYNQYLSWFFVSFLLILNDEFWPLCILLRLHNLFRMKPKSFKYLWINFPGIPNSNGARGVQHALGYLVWRTPQPQFSLSHWEQCLQNLLFWHF